VEVVEEDENENEDADEDEEESAFFSNSVTMR